MRSYCASKSTSTATTASVTVFGDSQPELAIEQHHQGSFADLLTTVHTPESTSIIPADDRPFAGLRLLAEVSTSQLDPFETLATHQTNTFDDEDQEQSASSLSLPDGPLLSKEPSQATDDAKPIREVAESHETGISEVPNRPSDQNLVIQDSDSTDKWIMCSGDKTKSFQCGYKGCGRIYTSKQNLRKHLASHIGGSQFRCYSGDCNGTIRYYDSQALTRHIHIKHTFERPFECNICNQRFRRRAHLQRHQQKIHSTEKRRPQKKSQNHHQNEREND